MVQYLLLCARMNALLAFYWNFSVPSILISVFGCFLVVQTGTPLSMVYVFWMKISTSFMLGLYVHFFKARTYVFYHNLGYSIRQLYAFTFLIDFAIWIALSLITIFIWL
jgi:hypothetical protein